MDTHTVILPPSGERGILGSLQPPWKALEALLGWQRREHEHCGRLCCVAEDKYEPLVSLGLLVQQFAQALNPLADKKGTFSAFSSVLDSIVYKFTNELLEC